MAEKKLKAIIETTYNGKGTKQAADDMNKVGKAAAQSKGIFGAMQSSSKGVSRAMAELSTGLLGPAAGFLGLGGAILGTVSIVRGSINDWVAYNEEVSKLSTTTTAGTEDLSRMMQAADDLGIEMGALKTSFEFASKNGVVPTIENIANLSDEMLAMTDIEKRNQEMTKIFGRGWADASRFLLAGGDAIREGTAAISDSLVVTDESTKKAREYSLALDALNDSVTEVKYSMSYFLVPALIDVIDWVNDAIYVWDKFFSLIGGAKFEDFGPKPSDVKRIRDMNEALKGSVGYLEFILQGTPWEGNRKIAQSFGDIGEEAETANEKISKFFDDLNTNLSGGIETDIEKINWYALGGKGVEDFAGAMKEKIAAGLLAGTITPDQAKKILFPIMAETLRLEAEMGEIPWEEIPERLADAFQMSVDEAREAVGLLRGDLIDIANQRYLTYIDVYVRMHGNIPGQTGKPGREGETGQQYSTNPGSTDQHQQGPGGDYAKGLDMTVPAGYPNDTYPIGYAQSGEHITITPAGEKSGGGTVVNIGDINVYESDNPQATAEAVIAIINRRMAGSRLAGARYTGA